MVRSGAGADLWLVGRDGRFRTGDRIVRINGHTLVDLTISQVTHRFIRAGNKGPHEGSQSRRRPLLVDL